MLAQKLNKGRKLSLQKGISFFGSTADGHKIGQLGTEAKQMLPTIHCAGHDAVCQDLKISKCPFQALKGLMQRQWGIQTEKSRLTVLVDHLQRRGL